MKARNFFLGMLPMVAALMLTACSNDDNLAEVPVKKAVPFTVTVTNSDASQTRLTVDGDFKTLRFQTTDKLYIYGEDGLRFGVLTIDPNTLNEEGTMANFTGDLTLPEGMTTISDETVLYAYLKGDVVPERVFVYGDEPQMGFAYEKVGGEGEWKYTDGTPTIYTSVQEAVQKCSVLKGKSTYGEKSFNLEQQMAFLNFEFTFTGDNIPDEMRIKIFNWYFYNTDWKVKSSETLFDDWQKPVAVGNEKIIKFVLPLPAVNLNNGYYYLYGSNYYKGGYFYNPDNEFFDNKPNKVKPLTGRVYNVKRTISN